jgi:YHS domain-containing protein
VFVWIVRVLILLLILRFILRLLFPARRAIPHRRGAGGPVERSGGELVRDPNCGTYVPKSRAVAGQKGGDTVYFCSTTCRDAYLRQ